MSATAHIVCACSEIIVKSQNGSVKLRSKILIFKGNDQAYAICKRCGDEVAVPVSLNKSAPETETNPPLILRS